MVDGASVLVIDGIDHREQGAWRGSVQPLALTHGIPLTTRCFAPVSFTQALLNDGKAAILARSLARYFAIRLSVRANGCTTPRRSPLRAGSVGNNRLRRCVRLVGASWVLVSGWAAESSQMAVGAASTSGSGARWTMRSRINWGSVVRAPQAAVAPTTARLCVTAPMGFSVRVRGRSRPTSRC